MQGGDIVQYFPQKLGSMENDTMVPLVQFLEKSWDFIPPDIVRPLASSTVSDIAIMARRLGMVWKTFDPGSGSMRAEGNGHVFTSIMARSLGTVLQYTYTSRKNDGNCAYIPVREADKLGFGLVEFDHQLFGPKMGFDLDIGSYEGIARTLPRFMAKRYVCSEVLFLSPCLRHRASLFIKQIKVYSGSEVVLIPIPCVAAGIRRYLGEASETFWTLYERSGNLFLA
jgi:hypothetical protein